MMVFGMIIRVYNSILGYMRYDGVYGDIGGYVGYMKVYGV